MSKLTAERAQERIAHMKQWQEQRGLTLREEEYLEGLERMLVAEARVAELEEQIDSTLSSFEKQVLDLYITGMSYVQIAKVLGKDEKSTDNALQRIKSKIKKEILKK